MNIRQLANLPGIKTSIKIVAASGLAVGVVASVSAAPAGAVLLTSPGSLAFNDGVLNTSGIINPVAGNTFTATFNGNTGGFNLVTAANGSFAPLFSPLGPKAVSLPSVNFLYAGGTNYTLQNNLDFNFTGIGTLRVASGSVFSSIIGSNNSLFSFLGAGSFITPDSISTPLTISSFNFDVDNSSAAVSPNGSYSLVASVTPTAAVPEPFTVIGTIIGGTVAFRMRKKLASSAKN